jgi:hypothetical protein
MEDNKTYERLVEAYKKDAGRIENIAEADALLMESIEELTRDERGKINLCRNLAYDVYRRISKLGWAATF